MPDPEVYLTLEEVAKMLQVHAKTVLRLVKADPSMPVIRLSAQTLRFPQARLAQWLKSREQGRSGGRSAHRSAHRATGDVSTSGESGA